MRTANENKPCDATPISGCVGDCRSRFNLLPCIRNRRHRGVARPHFTFARNIHATYLAMTILSAVGFLVFLIGAQRIPMPSWRLFAGCISVSMIVTGIDLLATLALPNHLKLSNTLWLELAGGVLIGAGVGFFVRLIRFKLSNRTTAPSDKENGEQAEDGDTSQRPC